MAFIPAPGTAMVEIRLGLDLQKVENTLYFNKVGAHTALSLAELGNDIIDWWVANIAPITNAAVVLNEVTCTDLTTDTSPSVTVVPATLTTGLFSGEVLPSNVSLAVSFRTAGRGRSSRGRNYFVGLTNSQVSVNQVTSGFATSLQAAYEAIGFEGFGTAGDLWVVCSRFHNKAPRAEALSIPITSVVISDPIIDSQRRRLPGRGT